MNRCVSAVALTLLAAQLATGLPALAQVAAPSLLPATAGMSDATSGDPSFVPVNPAVLAWHASNKVGLGVIRSELNQPSYKAHVAATGQSIPIPSASIEHEGTYGGFTIAGERFALAAESISMNAVAGDQTVDTDKNAVGAAARLGSVAAVGVSYHADKDRDTNNETRRDGPGAGISVRVWQQVYLGAAAGQEHVKQEALAAEGVGIDDGTTSIAYGVGYLSDGDLRLHLEYWTATLGAVKDDNGKDTLGGEIQTAIAEATYGPWAVGYTGTTVQLDFTGNTATIQVAAQGHQITVGLQARRAVAVLFHLSSGDAQFRLKNPVYGYTASARNHSTTRALSLVWQY